MKTLPTDFRHISLLPFMILILVAVVGCSDSTAPGGDDEDPPIPDVPGIPEPTTPGGETGAFSDTITVVAPLTTHYRPMVRTAYASWGLATRCCTKMSFSDWSCDDWVNIVGMAPTWSDSLPDLTIDNCGAPLGATGTASICRPDPWRRFLLVEDGLIVTPPAEGTSGEEMFWMQEGPLIDVCGRCRLQWQTMPIAERPHLRRDRFWVRQTLQNAGNFLLVVGGVQGTLSYTRTQGSSITETEEFGRTVTATAGLDLGALSLGVEVTLSQTFSTAVTVSEETSETISQTVQGEDGKTIHYQMWQLVESYSITDAEGEPFSDPYYTFEPYRFTIRNSALAMVATEFAD